jgi:hypothetical protein
MWFWIIPGAFLVGWLAARPRFLRGGCSGRRSWRRGGRFGRRFRGGGEGFILSRLLDEIDANPEQEKAIRADAEKLRELLRGLRGERGQLRGDIARLIGGEEFDEELLAQVYVRHDDVLRDLREQVGGLLGRLHSVLEPEQRRRLAELLERGHRGHRHAGGPYR